MQNRRMEPKGYPKLYIGTARGDIRLSSQHNKKALELRVLSFCFITSCCERFGAKFIDSKTEEI